MFSNGNVNLGAVAAWGIIGLLWDLLIASVGGLSESAFIRVASETYHDLLQALMTEFQVLFKYV